VRLIPTASEERWQAVAALAGESELTRANSGGWRSFSIFARIGFFVLGAICAFALWGLFAVFSSAPRGAAVVAGVATVGAAELIIAQARWFKAGLDEALYLCGVCFVLIGFVSWNTNEKVLFAAAALAALIAAVRLLNPLLPVVSLLLACGAIDAPLRPVVCVLAAIVALLLITRRVVRPSVEHVLAAFVIVMPAAAYVFAKENTYDRLDWPIALMLLAWAAAALFVGIVFRLHAPLVSLFVAIGALAYEVRNLTGMPLETRLIVWGFVLLVVAVAVDRLLRTPRNGITSEKLRDDQALRLLELAGSAAITPAAPRHDQPEGLQPGGGSFGGAGATGDF